MAGDQKLVLKRMGVMNITPNSFSDGGELSTPEKIHARLSWFGRIDALDIGAESTAPMNSPISPDEEWERLQVVLPLLKSLNTILSLDTYRVETIQRMVKFWKDEKFSQELIWNDISGKFSEVVTDFLQESDKFHYVLCHNLAPSRELSGKHMNYVQGKLDLKSFFAGKKHPQVIFDPCLGFSKSYEQNWEILENFHELQEAIPHNRWLIGFSRKSFLRRKHDLTMEQREELDQVHVQELKRLMAKWKGEVWIRTHRPELL